MYAARKGGTIVTCASTTGYLHEYDNRYLWMNLKRIIGSHFANYRESWEANRLIAKGMIHPTLSRTYPLDEVGQAALDVHHNLHQGKVGVLCLAPRRVSACATRTCAPAIWTRSTPSAASESHVRPGQVGVSQLPARGPRPTGWNSFPRIGQTGSTSSSGRKSAP